MYEALHLLEAEDAKQNADMFRRRAAACREALERLRFYESDARA